MYCCNTFIVIDSTIRPDSWRSDCRQSEKDSAGLLFGVFAIISSVMHNIYKLFGATVKNL